MITRLMNTYYAQRINGFNATIGRFVTDEFKL